MLLLLQQNNLLGEAPTLVEVPDVVGETQASGTTTLETALFAVAVAYAFSDSVPEGEIISQNPTAGSMAVEGSTVTITVSAGVQPVQEQQQNAGGWGFLNLYHAEQQRRKARQRERERLEEETEEIEDGLDREIAQLLRKQEAEDDKRKDRGRLSALAQANADYEAAKEYSERVEIALRRVIKQGNFSAIEALDRELKRAQEEEEFLLMAVMMLDG